MYLVYLLSFCIFLKEKFKVIASSFEVLYDDQIACRSSDFTSFQKVFKLIG